MAKTKRRSMKGMGAETFFGTAEETEVQEAGATSHGKTVSTSHSETTQEQKAIKTSFYPTQDQLDKLDDLATDYNSHYHKQRQTINRNDIVRYLIDQCSIETLDGLTL